MAGKRNIALEIKKLEDQRLKTELKIKKLQDEERKEKEVERAKRDPKNVKENDWKHLYFIVEWLIDRKLTEKEKEWYTGNTDEWDTALKMLKCRYDYKEAFGDKVHSKDRADEDIKRYWQFGVLEHDHLNNGLCNVFMRFENNGNFNNFVINAYNGDYGDWAKPEGWVECGNCGDIDKGKDCDNCNEAFCDNCLDDDLCSDCQVGDCSECGSEFPIDDLNICSSCGEQFCNDDWNGEDECCHECSPEDKKCEGCEVYVGSNYDFDTCFDCEKKLCGDCVLELDINGETRKVCRDCDSQKGYHAK